jgi:hypothetical protein
VCSGSVKRVAAAIGEGSVAVRLAFERFQTAGTARPNRLERGSLQHGLIVIAKSTHRAHIHENARIFNFDLSAEDMAELDALDQTGGTDSAQEYKWWEPVTSSSLFNNAARSHLAGGWSPRRIR